MPGCISTSTAFLFMDFSGNGKIHTAEYVWYGQCLSDVFIVDSHQKKKKKKISYHYWIIETSEWGFEAHICEITWPTNSKKNKIQKLFSEISEL